MKKPRTLFGKRLRYARIEKGISQKQLGIEAGIDRFSASARVNQYEVGTHTPMFETATKLAAVLGVPTPYFYAEDNLMAEIILAAGRLSKATQKRLLQQFAGSSPN